MDLGTGKDLAEYGGIRHHLIDILEPGDRYSVVAFQQDARRLAGEITARGNLPVVCGGSGYYLQALLFRMEFPELTGDLPAQPGSGTTAEMAAELERLDPAGNFAAVDRNNPRRLARAPERPFCRSIPAASKPSTTMRPWVLANRVVRTCK